MKLFMVISLLAFLLLGLLVSMDLLMGVRLQGIIMKELDPFRVMEAAEYCILAVFLIFFMLDVLKAFLNKKKKNRPTN